MVYGAVSGDRESKEVIMMNSSTTAFHYLNRLNQLHNSGFHNAFLDRVLRNIIDQQIAQDKAELERIQEILTGYETHYGMTSDEFLASFQAEQMADTADFMEWHVFCRMRQSLNDRLTILQSYLPPAFR